MTVETTTNNIEYDGNDSTTVFPFNFPFFNDSEIFVSIFDSNGVETPLTQNIDYTLPPGEKRNGGQINYPISGSPLPTTYTLIITRELPITQTASIRNQGRFNASVHETVFDKLIMILQQYLNRAFYRFGGNNKMLQDIDMNNHRILNLPVPGGDKEPLRKGDIVSDATGATVQYVDDKFNVVVKSSHVLSDATSRTDIESGNVINIAGRNSKDDGGGATWDVVLSSSVTADAKGIVTSTALPSLTLVQRLDREIVFTSESALVSASPFGVGTSLKVNANDLVTTYIVSLIGDTIKGDIDLGNGSFAKKINKPVNQPSFNRNALAIGVGESSSVGASWDYTHLDGVGFVSSNTTKNHAWLSPADTFQYVDVETPFGVIIGDSIAEGHGSPDRHGRLETGTVPIYDLALPNVEGQPSWYLSQKTNMHWYNQGIGGQTTTQVLARFRRDALGETVAVGDGRPDTTLTRAPYCVWVNAGINDISYGDDIETTKSNLLAMCDLAREAGIVIGFNTCGPHNSHDATQIQKQKEIQDFILTELPKRGAYTFDFRTWFEDPVSPDTINPSLNADNVHPSGAGYLSYVSELIKQSAAPIIMQQLCFESKSDPDNKPSSLIDSKLVNLLHVADGVYSSAEFHNKEAKVSCNFDMTNTTQLRATITGAEFPVTGADWITVSRVYGVFGNQKLPTLEKPPVYATIKCVSGVFTVETSDPHDNFIDVSIVSTTHLRVRFTRIVDTVRVNPSGTFAPYDFSANLVGTPRRECEIYLIDRSTGSSIDPNTATGTFFFNVQAR